MTDQNHTQAEHQVEMPPVSAAVHAIHNLKQYREDPRNNMFPGEAIGILERFVQGTIVNRHTPTPTTAADALPGQFRYAMHSLKRIADRTYEPVEFAAIAIKHILGPGVSVESAVGPAPVQLPFAVTAEELAALHRFNECAADGEGYDVHAEMMCRLAELGLLNRKSGAYFETTAFGMAVLDGTFASPASIPAPPAVTSDPALFDQWMHDRLFSNPPQPATPFDAWQAGRQLERQRASSDVIVPSTAPSQRALFEAWWQKTEIKDVSAREAKLRVWYAALEANPGDEFDLSQEHRFDDWMKAGAPAARMTKAMDKLKALLDKPGVSIQEMHIGYLEVSLATPQDEKDQFFDVWEAALAAQ